MGRCVASDGKDFEWDDMYIQ